MISDSFSFRLVIRPADHSSYKHLPWLHFPTPGGLSAWQQDSRNTKPKYPYVGIASCLFMAEPTWMLSIGRDVPEAANFSSASLKLWIINKQ